MFGERLAEIRKDNRYRQEDLAEKLNVSKYTISSWEQERSLPSLEMLVKICEVLDISADYLLGLIPWDPGYEYNRRKADFTPDEFEKIREYEQFLVYQRERSKRKSSKE